MRATKRKMAGKDSIVASKKSKREEPIPDTLVRLELYRKNDKPFDGRLSREDLLKVIFLVSIAPYLFIISRLA